MPVVTCEFQDELHRFVNMCQVVGAAKDFNQPATPDQLRNLARAVPKMDNPVEAALVQHVLEGVLARLADDREVPAMRLLHQHVLDDAARELLQLCLDQLAHRSRESQGSVSQLRACKAVQLIAARCQDCRLSSGVVAKRIGISSGHLGRLLRRHTGRGFAAHLRAARVGAATTKLRNSTSSIKEIAVSVGYTRTSDFDRHFRKERGVSPEQFRLRVSGIEADATPPRGISPALSRVGS
jgi:AraC-like DNA-binding protein